MSVRTPRHDLLLEAWTRWVEPAASGLPNWRVATFVPAVVISIGFILIALRWGGTSSGVHWLALGTGPDPDLISGSPRGIRSDEWLVQQGWVVSQANQGFPSINPMFAGGTDMTVLNELPSWDWSSIFRPHLWGFLFFGLDVGAAWQWWFPAMGLFVGAYLCLVALLPRRPALAAIVAGSLYFTPLLQWFYTASSLITVAWPLFAISGVVWVLKDPRRWVRVLVAAGVGYFAITMAMALYVPFIVPGLFVMLFVSVGILVREKPWRADGRRLFVERVMTLVVAALGAGVVTVTWVVTRLSTFDAIQSTVYPGQRTVSTGSIYAGDPVLAGFAGAPWNGSLKATTSSLLGGNSSEASSVILLAVFLAPGLLWFAIRSFRGGRERDWVIVSLLASLGLFLAFLFIPGWDPIAHLLQLDRVPPERYRIGFAVLLPLSVALIVSHLDRYPERRSALVGLVCAVFTALIMLVIWYRLTTRDPAVLIAAVHWKLIVVLILTTVVLLFVRRAQLVAVAALGAASVLLTWGVNPIYRGLFDLSTTAIGEAVIDTDQASEGAWVAIGSFETSAVLVESGVGSFSGTQTYPSDEMWDEIDPEGRYETAWNRLGHLQWTPGSGEPQATNPQADVIALNFDACSAFAQENVTYVLSDQPDLTDPCLRPIENVDQGILDFEIWKVVQPTR